MNLEEFTLATDEEIKKRQLNVLLSVDDFCKRNNIKYFLYYGSLLGAVRHSGFIPWDDDIDIAMLRDDYDRFISTFKDEKIVAKDVNKDADYPFYFAKVYDIETKVIENFEKTEYEYGLGIDVFPLDNIPNSQKDKKRMIAAINFRKKLRNAKLVPINKNRHMVKRMIMGLLHFCISKIKVSDIIISMRSVTKRYSQYSSDSVADIMFPYGEKSIVPKRFFDKIVDMRFEDYMLPVPAMYDEVLGQLYGDYMTPPPKAKQTTHHTFDAYVKK